MLVEPIWCDYDDLVVKHGVEALEYSESFLRLGWSAMWHGVGDAILKYGQVIGIASAPICAGDHVHVHNLQSQRGREPVT